MDTCTENDFDAIFNISIQRSINRTMYICTPRLNSNENPAEHTQIHATLVAKSANKRTSIRMWILKRMPMCAIILTNQTLIFAEFA